VGLPLGVEFAKKRKVVGFDINAKRVAERQAGQDHTLEVQAEELRQAVHLSYTTDPTALQGCDVFVVTVPTPIDEHNRPDLTPLPLVKAGTSIGKLLKKGDIVIDTNICIYGMKRTPDSDRILRRISGRSRSYGGDCHFVGDSLRTGFWRGKFSPEVQG